MGTVQTTGVLPAPNADILPFALAGSVPMANGAGWQMNLMPVFSVSALGTLATGTTTFNWAQYNYFTLTCYGGAMTFAFSNVTPGQMIKLLITGAASAAVTWPTTFTWIGITSAPAVSASAPVLTAVQQTEVEIVCTSAGNYVGKYIIN